MGLGSVLTLLGFTLLVHCAWGVSSCKCAGFQLLQQHCPLLGGVLEQELIP
jgi:hypothetical protein